MISPLPSSMDSRWRLLYATLIIVGACWVYLPALHGSWVWDDDFYFAKNPLLHEPARLWKAWFEPGSFVEYYPLEQSVQWLQWQLWGNDTFGYHLTNIALHIVSALLVWHLLGKFGLRLAWLGGLIFAIHPAMVESVAWISELKNTLSLPPFLLAMCAWIDYEENRRPRDYGLALGLFLVAMWCKISMAPFPVVILLYAWWKRGRIGRGDLKASVPFFVISLALTEISLHATKTWGHSQVATPEMLPMGDFLSRLALTGLSISFYFATCFLPARIMPIYPIWNVDPPSLLQFLPWPILAATILWFWRNRKSWGRHALLGLGFFLLNIGPFVAFGLTFFPRDAWVMNHFLYIPSIGLIGLAVAAAGNLGGQLSPALRSFAIGLATIVIVLLTWESHDYAGIFINPRALWTCAAERNPEACAAHNNLGVVFLNSNQLPEAIREFQEAIRLEPGYPEQYNGLGNALVLTGHLTEAMEQYREALRLLPNYAEAHNGLANALLHMGQFSEAMKHGEEALRIAPDYTEAHCTLGLVLAEQGRLPEAIEQFETAHRLRPNDVRIAQELDLLRNQENNAAGDK